MRSHESIDHQPMQALPRRATAALMAAMALAAVAGLVAWGPVGLVPHMHSFADDGLWLGVPNGMTVLTHVPLIPIGLWGIWRVTRLPPGEPLRWIWGWFFCCQMLATLGGMLYHLRPGDLTFIWDQLPKSAACSLFALAFLAERIDGRFGLATAIGYALGATLLGGVWWWQTLQRDGLGDLRPLLWLELLPVLLVATGAWTLSGHLLSRQDWLRSQVSFVIAQGVDWLDKPIAEWTHHVIGGHSMRHLALAACVGWVAYRLGARQLATGGAIPSREPDDAAIPAATESAEIAL